MVAPAHVLGLARALDDPATFARAVVGRPLRGYQAEIAAAAWRSIQQGLGETFTVMMPRQAGKNDTSAQLEAFLLTRHQRVGGSIVKTAPTFRPQIQTSIRRLRQMLDNPLTRGRYRLEAGYLMHVGKAVLAFMSGEPGASVVGGTATLLLEGDEAQDLDTEKWDKDFVPMGATGNATRVLWGTPWADDDLLAMSVARALELEKRDGLKRHFEVSVDRVAAENAAYAKHVQAEIDRLGKDHPIVRTQYLLERLSREGALFSAEQLHALLGDHPPQASPAPWGPGRYVAGIDVAGQDEEDPDGVLMRVNRKRDSTVVAIGFAEDRRVGNVMEPYVHLVALYAWRGVPHRQLYPQVLELLTNVWHCAVATLDATGVGSGLAAFLGAALGPSVVRPFTYTAATKSKLGYDLVQAVNAHRVLVYGDGGQSEAQQQRAELLRQCGWAQRELRANQVMVFYVPESRGHDDYLNALALLVQCVQVEGRRAAVGRRPNAPPQAGALAS